MDTANLFVISLTTTSLSPFALRVRGAECRVDEEELDHYRDPSPSHRDTLHQAQTVLNPLDEVFEFPDTIKPSVVSFFQELLSAPPQFVDPIRPGIVPRLVSDEDNLQLNRTPTLTKVREAIFSIDPNNVARWSEFCPASLCTMFNKLITKLMNSRLSALLPQIISAPQSGFISRWLIEDNVLLAQELLHTLDTKVRRGNVILKLDMAKAYDRMDWGFLISILESFGFDNFWIDRIYRCISDCRFSVQLMIMKPLKAILKKLEGIFARFLWDFRDHAHILHWRRWKDLCIPTVDGGLGFRRLHDLVDIFFYKALVVI
ncbi:Retrotransposon [Abeliophyllum distichum]|uniref:Retrotransposon n=1 Tax=Abeliophyllum distichum TaxID=126358 RepID=A0ABD1SD00_9LAMI